MAEIPLIAEPGTTPVWPESTAPHHGKRAVTIMADQPVCRPEHAWPRGRRSDA